MGPGIDLQDREAAFLTCLHTEHVGVDAVGLNSRLLQYLKQFASATPDVEYWPESPCRFEVRQVLPYTVSNDQLRSTECFCKRDIERAEIGTGIRLLSRLRALLRSLPLL